MAAPTATDPVPRPWQRRPEVVFPLRFLVAIACLPVLYWLSRPFVPAVTAGTAQLVAWASSLTGLAADVYAKTSVSFRNGDFNYEIAFGCAGLELPSLFGAAMVAYPSATWRQRIVGFSVATPALYALNLVRLVLLGWIGVLAPRYFAVTHELWMQAVLILLTGVGWLVWVRHYVEGSPWPSWSSERVKKILVPAGRFLAVSGVGMAIGLVGGIDAYRVTLESAGTVVSCFLWQGAADGYRLNGYERFATYATLVAVLALVATPGRGRLKVRRAVGMGMACLVVVHLVGTVLSFPVAHPYVAGGIWQQRTVHAVIRFIAHRALSLWPVVLWYAWHIRQPIASLIGGGTLHASRGK